MKVSIVVTRSIAALAVGAVALVATVGPAAATPSVPYSDPNAVGYIGICNQQNQQITTGSIHSAPFTWKVISSVPAPQAVSGAGRTATLYAYQPIKNLPSGYWSGDQMAAPAVYSNPAYPTAVSTERDFALSQFLTVFPPRWDGFVQLRMYLDAPGVPPHVLSYPALNLYISGDSWQTVGGGSVDCASGQAVSKAADLPITTTAKGGSGAPSSSSSSSTTGGGSVSSSGTGGKGGTTGAAGPSSSGSNGSGSTDSAGTLTATASKTSNVALVIVLVAAMVILCALVAVLVLRIKRRESLP